MQIITSISLPGRQIYGSRAGLKLLLRSKDANVKDSKPALGPPTLQVLAQQKTGRRLAKHVDDVMNLAKVQNREDNKKGQQHGGSTGQ
jgi:hypothetical protein